MRTNLFFSAFAIVCALTMWSCSGGNLPSSPSMLNPLPAPGAVGGRLRTMDDQIVFTNADLVLHHIVLDDGTDLGDVAPGQSSMPMPLTTPMATFHCTIHPSMIGAINGDIVLQPYEPPPSGDYY